MKTAPDVTPEAIAKRRAKFVLDTKIGEVAEIIDMTLQQLELAKQLGGMMIHDMDKHDYSHWFVCQHPDCVRLRDLYQEKGVL